MERRKLFTAPSRRRLFSSSTRRKLFSDCKYICQDCGYEVKRASGTTNMICPNCGSSRFNVGVEKSYSNYRYYSVSDGKGQKEEFGNLFRCYDCDERFRDPSETPSGVVCPNCGGSRVVQLEDVIADNATDEIMKEFSGRYIPKNTLQKIFTERGIQDSIDSLVDSGYASLNSEGMVCFSEGAWLTRKLFSELVISVTKELHLIPTEGRVEELVHNLEERGNISPKGIVLIKRAHGINPIAREVGFSETDTYIKDSGIASDLKLEYSGETMPLKEFMDILNSQYNDAPDDLLDRLVDTGVVKITGSSVEIN